MAQGLVKIRRRIAVDQFWPKGESDADTTKILVDVGEVAFRFREPPRADFHVTHAFDKAHVLGRVTKDIIDDKDRIQSSATVISGGQMKFPAPAASDHCATRVHLDAPAASLTLRLSRSAPKPQTTPRTPRLAPCLRAATCAAVHLLVAAGIQFSVAQNASAQLPLNPACATDLRRDYRYPEGTITGQRLREHRNAVESQALSGLPDSDQRSMRQEARRSEARNLAVVKAVRGEIEKTYRALPDKRQQLVRSEYEAALREVANVEERVVLGFAYLDLKNERFVTLLFGGKQVDEWREGMLGWGVGHISGVWPRRFFTDTTDLASSAACKITSGNWRGAYLLNSGVVYVPGVRFLNEIQVSVVPLERRAKSDEHPPAIVLSEQQLNTLRRMLQAEYKEVGWKIAHVSQPLAAEIFVRVDVDDRAASAYGDPNRNRVIFGHALICPNLEEPRWKFIAKGTDMFFLIFHNNKMIYPSDLHSGRMMAGCRFSRSFVNTMIEQGGIRVDTGVKDKSKGEDR